MIKISICDLKITCIVKGYFTIQRAAKNGLE